MLCHLSDPIKNGHLVVVVDQCHSGHAQHSIESSRPILFNLCMLILDLIIQCMLSALSYWGKVNDKLCRTPGVAS